MPTTERVDVFVDGFNLYFGLVEAGFAKYKWLDFVKMAERLNSTRQLGTVHYFTARVNRDRDAERRQAVYLDALAAHCGSRLRIVEGRIQWEPRSCKHCNRIFDLRVEKHTDVNLAAQMIHRAHTNEFDTAMLISADADQAGAIEVVQATGRQVRVVHPPCRESEHLKEIATHYYELKEDHLRLAQLPGVVKGPGGVDHVCPKEWQ